MWENAVRYSPIFYGIPQDVSSVFYPTKMQLASIAQRVVMALSIKDRA
jgi:hypothetical protein